MTTPAYDGQVGGRARTSLSSDGRSSRTSGGSGVSESNYMNVVSDGLFPDGYSDNNNRISVTTDDIGLDFSPKQRTLSSLLFSGNTQSLPSGLPPGSIAKFIMANQSPSAQNFIVEHLASFPQDVEDGYLTPAQALAKLKDISSRGGLWAQKMNMNVSSEFLIMANDETSELIEEYPMKQISLCIAVLDDHIFENLLIFATKMSQDKVGAIHLFQCKTNEAGVISEVVNKQRELKAMQQHSEEVTVNGGVNVSVEKQNGEAPLETRTEWNLHQRHAVARAVEAFQNKPDEIPQPQHTNNNNITNGANPLQDAKITRDVEILNKCIEEIENFVVMLKRINEARKQLQIRKSKGSRKKKVENILILQSQPPPDHRIFDIYQKFKHSLNLLGKLQPHISEPNAPELIHYLFIPLGIIVKVTGIEKARSVVEPLLTVTAVELLGNCLDSREYHFWQSLGPNWTLTKNAEPFKDRFFQVYTPVFVDGWVPPEIVTPQQEAAAKSVARMQEPQIKRTTSVGSDKSQNRRSMHENTPPKMVPVLNGGLVEPKVEHPVPVTRIEKKSSTSEIDGQSALRNNSFSTKPKVKYGIVIYDYMAHNNKELTIHAGEKVQVIDDSRRWWLVKNNRGEQGYVPSTVLEIPVDNSPPPSPKPDIPAYSPRQSNGHIEHTYYQKSGYDTNQNYVNNAEPLPQEPKRVTSTAQYTTASPVPQPVRTTTPVVISVLLPEGNKSRVSPVVVSMDTQTVVQTHHVNATSPVRQTPPREESPPYAVAQKQTITAQHSSGENASAVITTDYQTNGYHKSTAVIKTQSSPPTVQPELNNMPPPPPPPPVVPPPPPAAAPQQQVSTLVRTSSSNSGGIPRDDSSNDLQYELKNRLSMQTESPPPGQQKSLKRVESSPGVQQAMPDVDAVDVFIPLYKSSTADDVSRWLAKLGFSQNTIDALKGKTALELFKTKKDDMIDLIGPDEGKQLYNELQVQNGANTRNKGMTELQKALMSRVQKREGQQELARKTHHVELNGDVTKTPPQVKPKSHMKQASMDENGQGDALDDETAAIKKQKEELEKLKKENPVNRNPEAATFTSFSSPSAKTQL